MQPISINPSNHKYSLKLNYFPSDDKERVLIMVGGDGDTRENLSRIASLIQKDFESLNVITFSYRGVEEKDELGLDQPVTDLREVINYSIGELGFREIIIFATSFGAFPTCHIIVDEDFSESIREVIFFDPADYYLKNHFEKRGKSCWKGYEKYPRNEKVVSDLLKDISTNVKISVVNLTIRNYTKNGYVPEEERGQDHPGEYPRLSDDMVKAFWEKTPERNRKKYMEDNTVPHAIIRDGDIEYNAKRTVEIVKELLAESQ